MKALTDTDLCWHRGRGGKSQKINRAFLLWGCLLGEGAFSCKWELSHRKGAQSAVDFTEAGSSVKCPVIIPKPETQKCVGNSVNYAPMHPLNDGPDAEVVTLSKSLRRCVSGLLSQGTALERSQGKVHRHEKLAKAPGMRQYPRFWKVSALLYSFEHL